MDTLMEHQERMMREVQRGLGVTASQLRQTRDEYEQRYMRGYHDAMRARQEYRYGRDPQTGYRERLIERATREDLEFDLTNCRVMIHLEYETHVMNEIEAIAITCAMGVREELGESCGRRMAVDTESLVWRLREFEDSINKELKFFDFRGTIVEKDKNKVKRTVVKLRNMISGSGLHSLHIEFNRFRSNSFANMWYHN